MVVEWGVKVSVLLSPKLKFPWTDKPALYTGSNNGSTAVLQLCVYIYDV